MEGGLMVFHRRSSEERGSSTSVHLSSTLLTRPSPLYVSCVCSEEGVRVEDFIDREDGPFIPPTHQQSAISSTSTSTSAKSTPVTQHQSWPQQTAERPDHLPHSLLPLLHLSVLLDLPSPMQSSRPVDDYVTGQGVNGTLRPCPLPPPTPHVRSP